MLRRTGSGSAKKDESAELKSNESGITETKRLREIVYLDIERISSYLSQLEDGLAEYEQKFTGRGDAETSQSWGMGIGAPSPLNFNWGNGNTIGVDATVAIEQKRRHHAALRILEKALEAEGLIGSLGENTPFIEFADHGRLLNYAALTAVYRDFTALQHSAEYVGGQEVRRAVRAEQRAVGEKALKLFDQRLRDEEKKSAAERSREQEYWDHYSHILDQYADQLDVFFPNLDLMGPIEEKYLLVPKLRFGTLYGAPTRQKLTVIALDTPGDPAVRLLTPPNELTREVDDSPVLRYVAAYLSESIDENLGEALNESLMRPIIPIAMYFELNQELEAD